MNGEHPFSARADEPAITVPGLQVFVDAARAAPVREPQVSFDDVKAVAEARLFRRRTGVAAVVASVAAAVVITVNFSGVSDGPDTQDVHGAVASTNVDERAISPGSNTPPPTRDTNAAPAGELEAEGVLLAAHIEIEPQSVDALEPRTLDTHTVELGAGNFNVQVGEGDGHALTVRFADVLDEPRELVVEHGVIALELSADQRLVRLERGVAAWRSPDGTLTPIEVEVTTSERSQRTTHEAGHVAKVDGAARLARHAEDQLAAGQRGEAMATLRKLVAEHPRAPESRAGLLDLARLEKAAGRADASRCAYSLYLQRWPAGALSQDVERSLQRLGDGPACNGLRPAGK